MEIRKFVNCPCILFLCFILLISACTLRKTIDETKITPIQERALIRWKKVPKKVLAFYYPWHGTPEFSGRWRHYNRVNVQQKNIANFTHYPSVGPFDSNDPEVVARHMQLAKCSGIDGFIVSWWGQGSFEDKTIPLILNEAAEKKIEISLYYERVSRSVSPENAAADLLYILNTYGSHKAFQKLNGKPVVFIYERAINQLNQSQWASILSYVNQTFKGGFVAIGHGSGKEWVRIFDGTHIYNCAGYFKGKPLMKAINDSKRLYSNSITTAENFKRISAVTIIPGYDDTKIRNPGLKVERMAGEVYRKMWEMVINLNPDWVLITSFNEWHEGSEIEPSTEFKDLYLKITAEYTFRFKSSLRDLEQSEIPFEKARRQVQQTQDGILK
jgi:hypothetical protein